MVSVTKGAPGAAAILNHQEDAGGRRQQAGAEPLRRWDWPQCIFWVLQLVLGMAGGNLGEDYCGRNSRNRALLVGFTSRLTKPHFSRAALVKGRGESSPTFTDVVYRLDMRKNF